MNKALLFGSDKESTRISFAEATQEPLLLANRFSTLSIPQKAALKITYGLELDTQVHAPVDPHDEDSLIINERDCWKIFQEYAQFDDLGYPIRVNAFGPDYKPQRYREAWLVMGRRSGKTDSYAATITAYEAACGGHEDYLRPGQRAIFFQVAQDLRMARYSLHFIRAALESSSLLKKMIQNVTADRIDLNNNISIATVPPTTKSVRGYANPGCVLDEVGVWYQESDSANPDYEIYRAVSPGQAQFPDRIITGISSPWNKAGLLYRFYEAGTNGRKLPESSRTAEFQNVLVLKCPTAMMGNPLITREMMAQERARDVKAFEREFLAEFQDSISGFISSALVDRAIETGVQERPPVENVFYVGAVDPAFKRDAFAFVVGHLDDKGVVVVDVIRRELPQPGYPLNPEAVLLTIAPIAKNYGLRTLYSDQYHIESFGQLARSYDLSMIEVPFTSKSKSQMYANLQSLFLQGRIRLLDNYEMAKELRQLERVLTQQGQVQISAPQGLHDDLATAVCLMAAQAINLAPMKAAQKSQFKEPTVHERILAQIARKNQEARISTWD